MEAPRPQIPGHGRSSRTFVAILLATLAVAAGGCSGADDGASESGAAAAEPARVRPLVAVVDGHLAAIASEIAGDAIDVRRFAGVASAAPEVEELLAMQGADLILVHGAGPEPWRATASLPASRILNTTAKFADRLLVDRFRVTHSHGMAGGRTSRDLVRQTWLDPELARRQVDAVEMALAGLVPSATDDLATRADAIRDQVDAYAASLTLLAGSVAGRAIAVPDGRFEHLATALGVETIALADLGEDEADRVAFGLSSIAPGADPDFDALRSRGLPVITWDPESSGARWAVSLRDAVERLRAAIEPSSPVG